MTAALYLVLPTTITPCSSTTIGCLKAEEAKRLKHLEEENKRLKKLVADLTLDKDILKEALEGN